MPPHSGTRPPEHSASSAYRSSAASDARRDGAPGAMSSTANVPARPSNFTSSRGCGDEGATSPEVVFFLATQGTRNITVTTQDVGQPLTGCRVRVIIENRASGRVLFRDAEGLRRVLIDGDDRVVPQAADDGRERTQFEQLRIERCRLPRREAGFGRVPGSVVGHRVRLVQPCRDGLTIWRVYRRLSRRRRHILPRRVRLEPAGSVGRSG